jgi:hypothetical protein
VILSGDLIDDSLLSGLPVWFMSMLFRDFFMVYTIIICNKKRKRKRGKKYKYLMRGPIREKTVMCGTFFLLRIMTISSKQNSQNIQLVWG